MPCAQPTDAFENWLWLVDYMQRIQITFSKTGALKYIGHLDLNTIWERAARRAGLSLAYKQGFHPQPKIHLASALPLGYTSRCELADIRLTADVKLTELAARLQAAMPAGIGILGVEAIDESAPALQSRLIAAEYEVTWTDETDAAGLERRIEELLAASTSPRERRGKAYDLRPLIESLELRTAAPPSFEHPSAGRRTCLCMRLSAREGATGRPEEVLDALGIASAGAQIERTRLIFPA